MTAEHCGHRCANMLGMASLLGTGLKKPESHFSRHIQSNSIENCECLQDSRHACPRSCYH